MGKTVTTYLVDGDPKGTQYAFISNKICQMYIIPRSNLSYLKEQEKLQKPALYILLGEDKDTTKPAAYIGETENFKERVVDHDAKKEFWQKALVFVSKDEDMTKADVQYLEYKAISIAKKAGNFIIKENKQSPKAPNLPEYQRDAMDEFFEDVHFLSSFSGCNIFDIIEPEQEKLFYIKGRKCNCKGIYNADGFTVLKDSIIAPDHVPSFNWGDKRNNLIAQYTKVIDGALVLMSNLSFKSPSTAADFCTGRTSNGWREWKDAEGNTLDAIYRQTIE